MRANITLAIKNNTGKKSLSKIAYETIVRKIVSLEYQPGLHLEENQLVEDLKIGRTPIREALVRLRSERILESHPNRGAIVRTITVQDAKAMFEGMEIIERGIAKIVINKECRPFIKKMEAANTELIQALKSRNTYDLVQANHEFHMNFAKCSYNEFLIRAEKDVRNETKRLSYLSYDNIIEPEKPLDKHFESVLADHDEIIKCMKEKNLDQLQKVITRHIQIFKERIILFMIS